MLDTKVKLVYPLSFKSREVLYNFLLFYDLSSLLSGKTLKENQSAISFKRLLLSRSVSVGITDNNKNSLVRARVLCVNNAFLYLDLGRKFNLVKPKFRNNFKNFLNKEFLFSFYKTFQFCNFTKVKNFLYVFQYRSFKIESSLLDSGALYLKYLAKVTYKKSAKFFFAKLKKYFFSNYQKKINFFQFNILFKKYKY